MKKLFRVLLVLIPVILIAGIVLLHAAPAEPAVPAVAAPVLAADTQAARVLPTLIACRESGDGWMEFCLWDNHSALLRVHDGDDVSLYPYAFYSAVGGCPTASAGMAQRVTDGLTTEMAFVGFSVEEFAAWNVPGLYCSYAAE
jgi:hypothetical protein